MNWLSLFNVKLQISNAMQTTQSFTMKIAHTTTLFIAVLAVFVCSKKTWFEAQTDCRNMNQSITLNENESEQDYWTGRYKRTYHWIKIIGCYSASTFQNDNLIAISSASPFKCQEYCLQQSIYEFAVQGMKCVCLSPDFNVKNNQLPSSKCTYRCSNSALLSTECGGNTAFNVFFTDRTNLMAKENCLSLQCGNDPKILTYKCSDSLPPLCSTSILDNSTSINANWTGSMRICKMNDTYLLGNINLSNVTSACLRHEHGAPYWIGIFREKYFNTDKGQLIGQSAKTFFNKCQRCKVKKSGQSECKFVGCEEEGKESEVICSETKEVILPIPDTTHRSSTLQETTEINVTEITTIITTEITSGITKVITTGSSDTSEEKFSNEDNSATPIAVSVVLVLFAMAGCVIAIIIYKRRKNVLQEKETKSAYCPPANKKSERCSDTKTFDNTNYFVLQRPNSTYELADNFKLELESPYNEAEEGTYDHLGEKRVRKKHDDDTYNHASSAELSDLSDYDVANRKHLNNEDNTYDHTGVGNDSYGKVKSDLSDYDVGNREHRNEEDGTYDHTGVDSHGKYNSTQMNETDYSELS